MGLTLTQRLQAATRAFKFGGDLDVGSLAWGKSGEDYTPAEYGEYIATSNAVYACATLRAEMLSSLPLRLYRRKRNGDADEVTQGPLVDLLDRVNPFWTFNRLISMTELSLCLWGEAFWVLERGQSGAMLPSEMWWCRPDRMRVVPHPTDYISGFLYYPAANAEPIPFTPGEVLWLRFPNPMDEYEGLSPLAAARLAADSASAAMKSNRYIFANGLQAGGMLLPPEGGQPLTVDQQGELTRVLNQQFKGVSNAHRWGVFRHEFQVQAMPQVTPKDAEFTGLLQWSLEDVCRAYHMPLDMLGGQRTYANIEASDVAVWTRCIVPEARFIASEITEQLCPLFAGIDYAEFDSSDVSALHADEGAEWLRYSDQIKTGAITINEWRTEQGLEPVEWGDEPMRQANPFAMPPADDGLDGDVDEEPDDEPEPPPDEDPTRGKRTAVPEFNSAEHKRIWGRFIRRSDRWEDRVADLAADLFRRQRDSVLAKLKKLDSIGSGTAAAIFDRKQWVKTSRTMMRPMLKDVIQDFGDEALADLAGLGRSQRDAPIQPSFDFAKSAAARFWSNARSGLPPR